MATQGPQQSTLRYDVSSLVRLRIAIDEVALWFRCMLKTRNSQRNDLWAHCPCSFSIELVDIECVLGDVSGSRFCPYKSAILDVAYIVFITKDPGAS